MGLRLFHITEFADSRLTPEAQREAFHPAVLLLLASLWLAVAGNIPLWRELAQLSLGTRQHWWLSLSLALMTACALGAVLSLLNWRWLLKPALTLLLWLTVLNTALLWSQNTFLHIGLLHAPLRTTLARLWALPVAQLLFIGVVLLVLPTLALWNVRMRRVPLPLKVPQNALLFFAFAGLLVTVWFSSRQMLQPLLQDQSRWLGLLTPFNSLLHLLRP